jgi:hypothetical protein
MFVFLTGGFQAQLVDFSHQILSARPSRGMVFAGIFDLAQSWDRRRGAYPAETRAAIPARAIYRLRSR